MLWPNTYCEPLTLPVGPVFSVRGWTVCWLLVDQLALDIEPVWPYPSSLTAYSDETGHSIAFSYSDMAEVAYGSSSDNLPLCANERSDSPLPFSARLLRRRTYAGDEWREDAGRRPPRPPGADHAMAYADRRCVLETMNSSFLTISRLAACNERSPLPAKKKKKNERSPLTQENLLKTGIFCRILKSLRIGFIWQR